MGSSEHEREKALLSLLEQTLPVVNAMGSVQLHGRVEITKAGLGDWILRNNRGLLFTHECLQVSCRYYEDDQPRLRQPLKRARPANSLLGVPPLKTQVFLVCNNPGYDLRLLAKLKSLRVGEMWRANVQGLESLMCCDTAH